MDLQTLIDNLKGALVGAGTQSALEYVATVAPWTKLPIVRNIIEFLIEKIAWIIVNKTELGAFIVYTAEQKMGQAEDFKEAALALENAPKETSKEDLKKLQQAKIDAAKKLIKFTPAN